MQKPIPVEAYSPIFRRARHQNRPPSSQIGTDCPLFAPLYSIAYSIEVRKETKLIGSEMGELRTISRYPVISHYPVRHSKTAFPIGLPPLAPLTMSHSTRQSSPDQDPFPVLTSRVSRCLFASSFGPASSFRESRTLRTLRAYVMRSAGIPSLNTVGTVLPNDYPACLLSCLAQLTDLCPESPGLSSSSERPCSSSSLIMGR